MTEEFRFPPIHITRIYTGEDGRRVEEAVSSPVCDFCFDPGPNWTYDCETYWLDSGFASQGDWAVCDRCSTLIEADDYGALAARVYDAWAALAKRLVGGKQHGTREDAREIVSVFREKRVGEREPFG